MIPQLRSELLKVRTTRTTLGLLLALLAIVLLAVFAQGLSLGTTALAKPDNQRGLLGLASGAMLFSAFAGLLSITGEFRFGTIRPTLLFEPRRRRVLAAKLVVSGIVGAVFGAAAVGVAFAAGLPLLAARGVDLVLGGGRLALLVGGSIAGSALWAMIGVGVGALVRHQVGAIVGLIAWSSVVESLLFSFVPSVGRWLPGEASNALAGLSADHLLSAGTAAGALVVWTLALFAAGAVRTDATDVA